MSTRNRFRLPRPAGRLAVTLGVSVAVFLIGVPSAWAAAPTLTTTASASVTSGGKVSDTASLSGGANPTGTITFTLFGPANQSCTGTAIFTSTATVTGNGSYVSGSFVPPTAGTYNFVAAYSGDSNNTAVTSACGAANESVVVTKATPVSLTTVASASVPVGGTITDTATLRPAPSPAPAPLSTGAITFTLFGPDNATCSGSPIFFAPVPVQSGTTTSFPFSPTAPGTYRWIAQYGGDANNNAVTTACGDPGESVVVTPGPTLKGYQPLVPVRICDTRPASANVAVNQCNGAGAGGTMGVGVITVNVTGANAVPATAKAAVLNVTATNTSANSYLTVWPAGTARPNASNLNWAPGQTVPNLVEVALGAGGAVSVYNNAGSTDVVVDLEGYVDGTAPGLFRPLPPARICDTRPIQPTVDPNQCESLGGAAGTLGVGKIVVTVAGHGGVPIAGVTAVVVNVTATDTTGFGFLTVWPDLTPRPLASNVNWVPGQTVPNRVIVPLGAGGKIDVYNSAGATDVVIDVDGYYSVTPGGSGYTPLTPARLCDTRPIGPQVAQNFCNDPANGGPGPLLPGDAVVLAIPPGVTGAVFNVTVTNTTDNGFMTVFPDPTPGAQTPVPLASDLNWTPGTTVANLAVVGSGPAQAVAFFNSAGNTDVIIDLEGKYTTTPTAAAARPSVSIVRRGGAQHPVADCVASMSIALRSHKRCAG